jgi:hypothetical protein
LNICPYKRSVGIKAVNIRQEIGEQGKGREGGKIRIEGEVEVPYLLSTLSDVF